MNHRIASLLMLCCFGSTPETLLERLAGTGSESVRNPVAERVVSGYRGLLSNGQWQLGRLNDPEKVYNHYHNRMKMDMPWCKKAIEKTRPECGGGSSVPWSTLMYANQPAGLVKRKANRKSGE